MAVVILVMQYYLGFVEKNRKDIKKGGGEEEYPREEGRKLKTGNSKYMAYSNSQPSHSKGSSILSGHHKMSTKVTVAV